MCSPGFWRVLWALWWIQRTWGKLNPGQDRLCRHSFPQTSPGPECTAPHSLHELEIHRRKTVEYYYQITSKHRTTFYILIFVVNIFIFFRILDFSCMYAIFLHGDIAYQGQIHQMKPANAPKRGVEWVTPGTTLSLQLRCNGKSLLWLSTTLPNTNTNANTQAINSDASR